MILFFYFPKKAGHNSGPPQQKIRININHEKTKTIEIKISSDNRWTQ